MGPRRSSSVLVFAFSLCAAATASADDWRINLDAGRSGVQQADAAPDYGARMVARVGLSVAEARLQLGDEDGAMRPTPERSWRNRLSPNVSIVTAPAPTTFLAARPSQDDGEGEGHDFRLTLGASLLRVAP